MNQNIKLMKLLEWNTSQDLFFSRLVFKRTFQKGWFFFFFFDKFKRAPSVTCASSNSFVSSFQKNIHRLPRPKNIYIKKRGPVKKLERNNKKKKKEKRKSAFQSFPVPLSLSLFFLLKPLHAFLVS